MYKNTDECAAEYYAAADERAVERLLHNRSMTVDDHVLAVMIEVWRAGYRAGRESVLGDLDDGNSK